jgi:hypothetical protein
MVENYATEGGGTSEEPLSVLRPFSGTTANAVACATDGASAINGTCILVDPVSDAFRDYANGDYRPKAPGPLVNKGESYEGMPSIDLGGNKRLIGSKVDIGCYEANAAELCIRLR